MFQHSGVRNPEGARKAIESSFKKSLYDGKVTYLRCDTGDMSSVREFAEKIKQAYPAIHVLINNGESFEFWQQTSIKTASFSRRYGNAL